MPAPSHMPVLSAIVAAPLLAALVVLLLPAGAQRAIRNSALCGSLIRSWLRVRLAPGRGARFAQCATRWLLPKAAME